MAIGLIIICLILDYIFWQLYVSVLHILAFDGIIILMVKIWGLVSVYSLFWCIIHYTWYLLFFVWTYLYFLLFLIVLVAVLVAICRLSIVLAIFHCLKHRRRAQQLHNTEQTVLKLSERLHTIEEKQDDILQHVTPRAENQTMVREVHSNT